MTLCMRKTERPGPAGIYVRLYGSVPTSALLPNFKSAAIQASLSCMLAGCTKAAVVGCPLIAALLDLIAAHRVTHIISHCRRTPPMDVLYTAALTAGIEFQHASTQPDHDRSEFVLIDAASLRGTLGGQTEALTPRRAERWFAQAG